MLRINMELQDAYCTTCSLILVLYFILSVVVVSYHPFRIGLGSLNKKLDHENNPKKLCSVQ